MNNRGRMKFLKRQIAKFFSKGPYELCAFLISKTVKIYSNNRIMPSLIGLGGWGGEWRGNAPT